MDEREPNLHLRRSGEGRGSGWVKMMKNEMGVYLEGGLNGWREER